MRRTSWACEGGSSRSEDDLPKDALLQPQRMPGLVLGAAARAYEPITCAAAGTGEGQMSQPRRRSGSPATEPSGPGAKFWTPRTTSGPTTSPRRKNHPPVFIFYFQLLRSHHPGRTRRSQLLASSWASISYISLLLRCERISHCCDCARGVFGSQRLQTSQK
jgi:hypothetical protein